MFQTVIDYTGDGILYIVLGAVIRLIVNDMEQLMRRRQLQAISARPQNRCCDVTENKD